MVIGMKKQMKPDTQESQKARRKVLKSAGIVGGVAAGAVWHKPAINSVLLPAHAQTSMVSLLGGGSTSMNPFAALPSSNKVEGLAKKLMDQIIPTANALEPPPSINVCLAFTDSKRDDYTHCVSLEIPASTGDPETVNVTLAGPTIYAYSNCYYNDGRDVTYYYTETHNFSGASNGASLTPVTDGFDFSVTINGIEINGMIDASLDLARGTMVNQTGQTLRTGFSGINADFCSTGYGAFWEADLAGASSCSAGAGVSSTYPVAIADFGYAACNF